MSAELLIDGPDEAPLTVALAHGAGAPMDSPFMSAVAQGVAAGGYRAVRFEFPYMRQRRLAGKRGRPDRPPVLLETWHNFIHQLGGGERLVIGGKSLGGRMASMVADEAGVRGLVCLGYPFHPPGREQQLRTAHLEELATPTLIVQGTRDPFGRPDEVAGYRLSESIRIAWIEDGNHSLVPRKSSGRTPEQNLRQAIDKVLEFLKGLAA